MSGSAFTHKLYGLIGDFEAREMRHIEYLGERLAQSVISGHVVHLYDNGHMLNHELFNRAGGLALLAQLNITPPTITNTVVRRHLDMFPLSSSQDHTIDVALARFAIERSSMIPGDYLLIGSVSGRSPFIVELALEARRAGIHTVALTALRYTQSLPARHPKGKLLYQIADEIIDIQTEEGDASVHLDGLEERIAPTSGIMAAVAMWTLEIELAQALLKRGVMPTVFRSVNYPDGPERFAAAHQRFTELGY